MSFANGYFSRFGKEIVGLIFTFVISLIPLLWSTTIKESNDVFFPTVEVNYESGIYNSNIDLEIECEDDDVEFFYTINGNRPTEEDEKYQNPINLDSTDESIALYPLQILAKKGQDEFYVNKTYVICPCGNSD